MISLILVLFSQKFSLSSGRSDGCSKDWIVIGRKPLHLLSGAKLVDT